MGKVEQLYLQDLLGQTQLSPTLSLLQLIALSKAQAPQAAQNLLTITRSQGIEAFRQTLDLVEGILVHEFPQLNIQEILTMLDLKTAYVNDRAIAQLQVLKPDRPLPQLSNESTRSPLNLTHDRMNCDRPYFPASVPQTRSPLT
jgi:hypothetical protein